MWELLRQTSHAQLVRAETVPAMGLEIALRSSSSPQSTTISGLG